MIKQEVHHYAEGRPRKVMAGKLTKEGGDIRFENRGFTDLQTDRFYPLLDRGSDGGVIHANLGPVIEKVNGNLMNVIDHVLDLHWSFEEKA